MSRQRSSATRADTGRDGDTRRRIAVEAARLISEQGIRDYHVAKRKAAERLGLALEAALPKNSEIEEALREHQRLFAGEDQPRHLGHLREVALEAMHFFARFDPRVVGPVLDGSADQYSSVCLHLFVDEAEAVARFLEEHRIPFEENDRELRVSREERRSFPAFAFNAGDTPIDVTVLPVDLQRQAPLDRDGDRPMQRATRAALQAIMETASANQRLVSGR